MANHSFEPLRRNYIHSNHIGLELCKLKVYYMLRSILFVLSIVSLASGQCGVGEFYTSCGSACPATCDNFNITDMGCIALCVPGCFCEEGKVRAPDGTCIQPSACVGYECDANQQYECGTECPATCDNYDQPSLPCIESCRLGCFCKQGSVLLSNTSAECVHTSQCPGREGCRPDEHYTRCGTACPATCDNSEPIICTLNCVAGCFCNDGYVRNESECIKESACLGLLGNGINKDSSAFLFVILLGLLVILLISHLI